MVPAWQFWLAIGCAWGNWLSWLHAFLRWRKYSRSFFRLGRTIGTGTNHSLRVYLEELNRL